MEKEIEKVPHVREKEDIYGKRDRKSPVTLEFRDVEGEKMSICPGKRKGRDISSSKFSICPNEKCRVEHFRSLPNNINFVIVI